MAQITINIPDDRFDEVKDLLGEHYGYRDMIPNEETGIPEPNPQGKGAFLKQSLIDEMKANALRIKKKRAMRDAELEEIDIT